MTKNRKPQTQPNSTPDSLTTADNAESMLLTDSPVVDTTPIVEKSPIQLITKCTWNNHLGAVTQYTVADVIVWENGIPMPKRGLAGAIGERAGANCDTMFFGSIVVEPEQGSIVINKSNTVTVTPVLDENGQPTVNKAGKPIVKSVSKWTWIKSLFGAADASADSLFVNSNGKSANLPALQPTRNMIDFYATAHNLTFVEPKTPGSVGVTAVLRQELAAKDDTIKTMDAQLAQLESEKAAYRAAVAECKLAIANGDNGAMERLFALMESVA